MTIVQFTQFLNSTVHLGQGVTKWWWLTFLLNSVCHGCLLLCKKSPNITGRHFDLSNTVFVVLFTVFVISVITPKINWYYKHSVWSFNLSLSKYHFFKRRVQIFFCRAVAKQVYNRYNRHLWLSEVTNVTLFQNSYNRKISRITIELNAFVQKFSNPINKLKFLIKMPKCQSLPFTTSLCLFDSQRFNWLRVSHFFSILYNTELGRFHLFPPLYNTELGRFHLLLLPFITQSWVDSISSLPFIK